MTTVRRVKASQFAEQFQKDMDALRARLVVATHETAPTGAKLIAQDAPHAFGEIADGMVSVGLRSGAKIRSTAPHSAAVEVGSRPHFPPISPIEKWVKLRGMQGLESSSPKVSKFIARWIKSESVVYEGTEIKRGPNKGAIRIVKRKAAAIDLPRQIAIMICRAIAKRGTKPTWFVRKKLPMIKKILGAAVRAQLSRPL